MFKSTRAAMLLGAALLAPLATPVQAQEAARQLEPTVAAVPAKTAFRAALYEAQNVSPQRARQHLVAALQADPDFALAQVYQTVLAAGLTAAERESRIAPVLGPIGNASPAEVLLALYWRETASGRGAAAVPILRAAAELVPDDAEIAYAYDNTQRTGMSATAAAASLRRFLERFPTHAAAHNQLAYTLWRAGDPAGALAAVQQYAKHAPEHPNAHDSYADILLLLGRGAEALPHVQREIELDPDFAGAHNKLGSIYLTMGNVKEARGHFAAAASGSTTPAARIEAMHWQATSHVYAGDPRSAVQELMRIAEVAKTANMPGAVSIAFNRAAVIDAHIGNRKAVPAHLAAAAAAAVNDAQRATAQAHAAVALSRMGKAEEAGMAAKQFAALAPDNEFAPALAAILALDTKNYAAAESALGNVAAMDPLAKALRAELLMRTGRNADGKTLREEVLSSSLKMDGNPPVQFFSVIARMRASKL
jgi:tetratricopeptide (TPR) repeat protein